MILYPKRKNGTGFQGAGVCLREEVFEVVYSDFPGFLPESLHPILTQLVESMDINYSIVPGSTPEPPESIRELAGTSLCRYLLKQETKGNGVILPDLFPLLSASLSSVRVQ